MSLPEEQRHKKCAEILRSAIESDPITAEALLTHYGQLCQWMLFNSLLSHELEALADRYHAHLELAGQNLKEDRLLHLHSPSFRHNLPDQETREVEKRQVTLFLDSLRTAHNIGSIIRSAECFGLGNVVLSPKMVGLASTQVKRAAMGCENWIPVLENLTLDECPRPWIALETNPDAKPIYDFAFPDSFTLVVGNEEYGISESTLNRCDECLRIPLYGKKNSLNVAAALAVAAYEIRRQQASS